MPSKARQDFWDRARRLAGKNGPGGTTAGTTPPTTPLTLPKRAPKKASSPAKNVQYTKQKG